ncbi:MAG TPA: S41 family peptidase [Dyella sp.]|uniref:S41 family peptidase n=1 Tax=Dyella sp. TaxID=1869338 RepID=UPI002F938D6A
MSKTIVWALLVLISVPVSHAQDIRWNTPAGYVAKPVPDLAKLRSPEGIDVDLIAGDGSASPGYASAVIDAAGLKGKQVRLVGDIAAMTSQPDGGASIYLQVYAGKTRLAFATSEVGGKVREKQHREVPVFIPEAADRLVIGVTLTGNGQATVHHLHLSVPDVPTATAEQVVHAAIELVRSNAFYASRIDWNKETSSMEEAAKKMSDSSQAWPSIQSLIAKLQDRHSRFLSLNDLWNQGDGEHQQEKPEVRILEQGIGYVKVPGFVGANDVEARQFSHALADGIAKHAKAARSGWVVDLRQDTGGNMWVMLSGLHALLGTREVGASRDRQGVESRWIVPMGQGEGADDIDLQQIPVAVLIGSHTSSSGEAVAVAFKGRARSRFFGQPTDGLSNVNRMYRLPDGTAILLTCAVDMDRGGHAYESGMTPDTQLPDDLSSGVDTALGAARDWLKHSASL